MLSNLISHVLALGDKLLHAGNLGRLQLGSGNIKGHAQWRAKNNLKWCAPRCTADGIVECKLALSQQPTPVALAHPHVVPEHLLNRTMKPFGQTICLRVIGWGHGYTTLQKLHQLLPKIGSEAYISVTNDLARHSKFANPMFKEHVCNINSSTSRMARNKLHIPTKTIHNAKYSIITPVRHGQWHNEVHADVLKGSMRVLYRFQRSLLHLSWGFILLAQCTIFTNFLNFCIHIEKIEVLLNQLEQILGT